MLLAKQMRKITKLLFLELTILHSPSPPSSHTLFLSHLPCLAPALPLVRSSLRHLISMSPFLLLTSSACHLVNSFPRLPVVLCPPCLLFTHPLVPLLPRPLVHKPAHKFVTSSPYCLILFSACHLSPPLIVSCKDHKCCYWSQELKKHEIPHLHSQGHSLKGYICPWTASFGVWSPFSTTP